MASLPLNPWKRERSMGVLAYGTCTITRTGNSCADQGPHPTVYQWAGISGNKTTMTDWVTPGFKRRSAKGEIFNNPKTKVLEVHSYTGDFITTRGATASCSSPLLYMTDTAVGVFLRNMMGVSAKVPQTDLFTADEMSSARKIAATQAWSKGSGHDAEVLVDLAEMRQTVQMLRNPVQGLGKLLNTIFSGSSSTRKKGQSLHDWTRQQWLQYRYGVRPLISSIDGIIKAVRKRREHFRWTARGQYSISKTSTVDGTYTNTPGGYKITHRTVYTDVCEIRCGLMFEEHLSLLDNLGVDATGLLTLPWELVPFSFVADWFGNLNAWIAASYIALNKKPAAAWTTTTRSQTGTFKALVSTSISASVVVLKGASDVQVSQYVSSTRDPFVDGPSLGWKPQALAKVSDDLRLLDSYALITQKFGNLL